MTITYTTTINAMYTVPNPVGYVVDVMFTLIGVDNSNPPYTASIQGSVSYSPSESDPSYIPYDQLTQAIVLGWINEVPNLIPNLEANVAGQIQSLINPPVVPSSQPLPWSN